MMPPPLSGPGDYTIRDGAAARLVTSDHARVACGLLATQPGLGPSHTRRLRVHTDRSSCSHHLVAYSTHAARSSRSPRARILALLQRRHSPTLPGARQEVRTRVESQARQPVRRGAKRLQDDPRGLPQGGVHRQASVGVQ